MAEAEIVKRGGETDAKAFTSQVLPQIEKQSSQSTVKQNSQSTSQSVVQPILEKQTSQISSQINTQSSAESVLQKNNQNSSPSKKFEDVIREPNKTIELTSTQKIQLTDDEKKKESEGGFYLDLRPKIVNIPEFTERSKIDMRYPLIPPFAFAHIYWDAELKEIVYKVEEPILNEAETELLKLLQLGLEEMINISYVRVNNLQLILQYLEKNVQSILVELGTKVSKETYNKIMYYIFRDSVGLNDIEPLMRDYFIEDVECNGVNFPIYIVHRKFENLRTTVIFKDSQQMTDFVEKLSQKAGRYVSYANPLLDGTLPDGSRVNATYSEDVTTRGPTFTIRKFTAEPWTPIHLIKFNTVSSEALAFLWVAIQHKFNIMTIGETASGKTTFLNAFACFVPPEARIVSIEDTRELNLAHINWLPAVTRTGFGIPNIVGKKVGEITLFDLLRETFRQNPDYVILGETRGKETYVLFQGMASGHPSFATFHAASVETMVRRLETPPISLPPSLVESLDIVNVVTNVKEFEKSKRRLKQLCEIKKLSHELGMVEYNSYFTWDPVGDTFVKSKEPSVVISKIAARIGVKEESIIAEILVRKKILDEMAKQDITDFKMVTGIINAYYKDRPSVLKQFNITS